MFFPRFSMVSVSNNELFFGGCYNYVSLKLFTKGVKKGKA